MCGRTFMPIAHRFIIPIISFRGKHMPRSARPLIKPVSKLQHHPKNKCNFNVILYMGYGKMFLLTPGVNFIGRKLGKSWHSSFEIDRKISSSPKVYSAVLRVSFTSTVAVTRLGRHANTNFLLAFPVFLMLSTPYLMYMVASRSRSARR